MPTLVRILGNPNFKDESLIAYEAGYRTMLSHRLSIDFAAYFDDRDNARSTEPSSTFFEATPPPPHLVQTLVFENLIFGEDHGFELEANWKVTEHWSISSGFTDGYNHVHTRPNSRDTLTAPFVEGSTSDHMVQLRSHVGLVHGLAWNASAYYMSPLTNQGPSGKVRIPAYTRLDIGMTWKPWERCSFSIVGQNLLKDHHMEFEDANGSLQSGQIKRSAYAKISWQF